MISKPMIAVVILLWWVSGFDTKAAEGETSFADAVIFGNLESERSHGLTSRGAAKVETLAIEMGGYEETRMVRTVAGKGAAVTVRLRSPEPGQRLLLEVQEIHDRRSHAFGYMVLIAGQEVYFRTYEEYGAGPNHYFIEVGPELLPPEGPIEVTFRSESNIPFSLGRLWVYHDFFSRVAEAEKVYRPMGLTGFLLAKTEPKPEFESYWPIGTFGIAQYCQPTAQVRDRVFGLLRTGAAAGELTIWQPNGTAWGGKPVGPDGCGGYFSDPRYGSLFYDAAAGTCRPSWPNMWGNTAWPTAESPWMNQYLERRFEMAMAGAMDELDVLKGQGTPASLVVVREWTPEVSEISTHSVQRAAQDGIVLDLSDGLSRDERLWLHRRGVQKWREYAASTRALFLRDSVLVDRGNVRLPETQVRDNLYSQADFLNTWPMDDVRWNGGQMGMVPGLWSSGEMGQGTEYKDIAMYDYVRARGRLAMVNMERTILKQDFSVLRNHYERGFQFVVLFNDEKDDAELIRAVDRIGDEPTLPAVQREPTVLGLDFPRDQSLGAAEQVAAVKNLHILHQGQLRVLEPRAPRLAVQDRSRPGEIVYRLENAGMPFPVGLNLSLEGRISEIPGNRIEVHAGPTVEAMSPVRVLTGTDLPCPNHWTHHMTSETTVDLGDDMVGQESYFLRLVIHSPSATDAAFLLALHISSQWPQRSGYVAHDPALTVRQSRIMQLWVQDRALAEWSLDEYARCALASVGDDPVDGWPQVAARLASHGEALAREYAVYREAEDLFDRGWYRSAYTLLSGEISQVLPARYVVRGHGTMGCHPVEVVLPAPDQVAVLTLQSVSPQRIEFSVNAADEDQLIQLSFPSLDPAREWRRETLGLNHYAVVPAAVATGAAVSLAVENGQVAGSVEIRRTDPPVRQWPSTLTARYLGGDRQRIQVDLQDLEIMGYQERLELPVARELVVSRTADRLSSGADARDWPEPLDLVELTLDEAGKVTRIAARYGLDRGRIKAFHPPVLFGADLNDLAVGGIELDNGNRYEFDFHGSHGTIFDTIGLHENILNYSFSDLEQALKPGEAVELTYCPYVVKGNRPRLRRVTQPYQVLIAEDFTKTEADEWKIKAHSLNGLEVIPHKPEPNYLYNVAIRMLRPTDPFVPGQVVYQIKSEKPLGSTALEFAARAFEDSSVVEFLVSADGKEWIKCGQFDNRWPNSYSQSLQDLPPMTVDLTPAVKGLSDFFLKLQLTTGDADGRFCFARFRVLTGVGAE